MPHDEHIAILRDFVPRLRALIAGLSPQQLTTVYIEGEWTIAQNVHHLFDAHVNAYQLARRVLSEDNASLSWPQQDVIAQLPDAQDAELEPSLRGLEGLHARWTQMFGQISDWSRAGTSAKSGKVYTIADLLALYARHCENHIVQIQAVLDAMPDTP
ncbi:MAG: DinB family protein [Anaerolineae bacterium]